jgi:hypothetical protein
MDGWGGRGATDPPPSLSLVLPLLYYIIILPDSHIYDIVREKRENHNANFPIYLSPLYLRFAPSLCCASRVVAGQDGRMTRF